MPTQPPPLEIALILTIELLFGVGYNSLIDWAQRNRIWHVSVSVIFGVTVTLLIPCAFWARYEMTFGYSVTLLFLCFAASGLWMVVGSTKRTVASHQRKPWPKFASGMRDEAIMQLSDLIREIEQAAIDANVTAGFLLKVTNGLHSAIKLLKSV